MMPSRLQKFQFSTFTQSLSSSKQQDTANENPRPTTSATPISDANRSTGPSSSQNGAANIPRPGSAVPAKAPSTPSRSSTTIRTVPTFDDPSDSSSSPRNSGFSASNNSNTSGASSWTPPQQEQIRQQLARLKSHSNSPGSGNLSRTGSLSRTRSVSSRMSTSESTPRADGSMSENVASLHVPEAVDQATREGSPGWDGAVGKAGLGKTGRVINKLVSDNEALKRDIQIERLKADEYKQAAKLVEDKTERMVSDYESRLLEANVTKTLLSRKERQVESLQAAVELEKKRTSDAQERERTWRDEMEKTRRETKIQVEEANNHAALMEGRYNAISSHWRDQGAEVKRATADMKKRITELNEERRKDDDKIATLRDLCDQQDANIRDLLRQRDEMGRQFEDYKQHQEDMLKDVKTNAREREEEQLHTIEETKRVLGELRWALNVKRDVPGAE